MMDTERFEFEGYDVYVVVDGDGNRTVIDPVEELTQMSRQIDELRAELSKKTGELETCRKLWHEAILAAGGE